MGMVQAGKDPSLVEEPLEVLEPRNVLAVRNFDGHITPEVVVMTPVDGSETSGSKLTNNSVPSQAIREIRFSGNPLDCPWSSLRKRGINILR
jgi:hypothetical protein